jgi:MCP family monocarboxylic acid transporter-like MFS transporter 10
MGARMGAFYPVVAISSLIGTPIAGALIGGGEGGYRGLISCAVCIFEYLCELKWGES